MPPCRSSIFDAANQDFVVPEIDIALGEPIVAKVCDGFAREEVEWRVRNLTDAHGESAHRHEPAALRAIALRIGELDEDGRFDFDVFAAVPGALCVPGPREVPDSKPAELAVTELHLIADGEMRAVALHVAHSEQHGRAASRGWSPVGRELASPRTRSKSTARPTPTHDSQSSPISH